MNRWVQARRASQHGFTLVEVLIALVLIAMLMLLLTAAMRSMGQTETAIQERVAQTDDYRSAVNFLRDVLGEVSARPLRQSVANGKAPPAFFQGQANELVWIGVMPARYGVGGRHYMRLTVEQGALTLSFAPWNGAATFSAWGSADKRVLVAEVAELAMVYQDGRNGQWLDRWPPDDVSRTLALPSAVQIDLQSQALAWPSLVVAVNGLLAADASNSPITFGGGASR